MGGWEDKHTLLVFTRFHLRWRKKKKKKGQNKTDTEPAGNHLYKRCTFYERPISKTALLLRDRNKKPTAFEKVMLKNERRAANGPLAVVLDTNGVQINEV